VLEIILIMMGKGLGMEELSREEVVKLALTAGLGRHEVLRDIVKMERFARLVQKASAKDADEIDMDGRC
jgi:hypothetical protein